MKTYLNISLYVLALSMILSACSGGEGKYDMLVGDGAKRWYYRKEGVIDLVGTVSKSVLEKREVVLAEHPLCTQDDAWLFGGNNYMSYWFGSIQCDQREYQNKNSSTKQQWSFVADSSKLQVIYPNQYTEIWDIKRLTCDKLHIRTVFSFSGGDSIRIIEKYFEYGL